MANISIVYHSGTGTTAQLAQAVRDGAAESSAVGVVVALHRITGDEIIGGRFRNTAIWAELERADAIIFGSPTYMGGPSAQFKAFADATGDLWSERRWADKVAAGFTVGSAPNGDQSSTLAYLNLFASQHGMIWCGLDIAGGYDPQGRNRLGTQVGVAALSDGTQMAEIDLVTARYLGNRVAQLARRLAPR